MCAPTAGAPVASGLALVWTLGSLLLLLWPPELPSAFSGERLTFEITQLVPLALLLLVGGIFTGSGRRGVPRHAGRGSCLRLPCLGIPAFRPGRSLPSAAAHFR